MSLSNIDGRSLLAKAWSQVRKPDAQLVSRLSGYFLAAVLLSAWGFAVGRYYVFPWSLIEDVTSELEGFVAGAPEGNQITLTEKIQNDFFGTDDRYKGQTTIGANKGISPTPLSDPQNLLRDTNITPKFYSTHKDGYYFVQTLLNMPDAKFGALLLDANGTLIRVYKRPFIDSTDLDLGKGGFTEDGNVIFNSHHLLYVTNFCGEELFQKNVGRWHHDASGDDGFIWAWESSNAIKLDAATGNRIGSFSMLELIAANPELNVLEPRMLTKNRPGFFGRWKYSELNTEIKDIKRVSLIDPFHQNDIDVLPKRKATLFPGFEAGDLLLSFRSINLIVVVDPNSLKIKWYKFGIFSRQHDPDWSSDGTITLFDNQSHNQFSRILRFDPNTEEDSVAIDGSKHDFHMFAHGAHDVDRLGRIILLNRAEFVHFDLREKVIFYFTNWIVNKSVRVSNMQYIEQEEFEDLNQSCR